MSDKSVGPALKLGSTSDQMTGHGFRSTASTLLNESRKWHPDAIERALAHGALDWCVASMIVLNIGMSGLQWRNGGLIIWISCSHPQLRVSAHDAP